MNGEHPAYHAAWGAESAPRVVCTGFEKLAWCAAHFGAALVTFPGGYRLQFGRRAGLHAMEKVIHSRIG